jgi:hypothetical protein
VGYDFRLLPAGRYRIGLSDEELAAARAIEAYPNLTISEMTPVRSVWLAAVLLS